MMYNKFIVVNLVLYWFTMSKDFDRRVSISTESIWLEIYLPSTDGNFLSHKRLVQKMRYKHEILKIQNLQLWDKDIDSL